MGDSEDEEEAAVHSQRRRGEQALRASEERFGTHREEAEESEAPLRAAWERRRQIVETLQRSLERLRTWSTDTCRNLGAKLLRQFRAWNPRCVSRPGLWTASEQERQVVETLQQSLERLRTAWEQERQVVETLQQSFLPRAMPAVSGVEFGHGYWPARQQERVGGDFYDVVPLDAHRLAFCIGDVSGKGIEAALFTAMARNMWRGFLVEDPRLETLMARLNNALTRFMETEQFVTMLCGLIDRRTGDLQYVVAGHPPLLRRSSGRGGCEALAGRGMVLGAFRDMCYEVQETRLGIGDLLLLYTDGISELRRDREMLDVEGLRDWLGECRAEAPAAVVQHLYERAREWCGGPFADDVALVAIRCLERAPDTLLEATAPASAAASRRRILVVGGYRDGAAALQELLELAGHEVVVAYSGPDGVAAARRFRPEVVLCGLGLPGMDGCAVAAELRRDPTTAAARLIAVTSYAEEEDRRRSRAAGFELHLTKPVNFVELERILAAMPPSG
jgi:serine phosphatase RsbU (regulator of sigma subunit)/ActR/RegA family two-component response regulator